MNRTLRMYLRLSLVLAIAIALFWLVYFAIAGTLPPVTREIVLGERQILLPFALPHCLDFLAAPIFIGLGVFGYLVYLYYASISEEDVEKGLLASFLAVYVLSAAGSMLLAILCFFQAGLLLAAIASIPLTFLVAVILTVTFWVVMIATALVEGIASRTIQAVAKVAERCKENPRVGRVARWLQGD